MITYVPVTTEVLNSLTPGKRYVFSTSAHVQDVGGVAYMAENGNTYINFGNIPIYDDWKIKHVDGKPYEIEK